MQNNKKMAAFLRLFHRFVLSLDIILSRVLNPNPSGRWGSIWPTTPPRSKAKIVNFIITQAACEEI